MVHLNDYVVCENVNLSHDYAKNMVPVLVSGNELSYEWGCYGNYALFRFFGSR